MMDNGLVSRGLYHAESTREHYRKVKIMHKLVRRLLRPHFQFLDFEAISSLDHLEPYILSDSPVPQTQKICLGIWI
jgi:hypothetical protein